MSDSHKFGMLNLPGKPGRSFSVEADTVMAAISLLRSGEDIVAIGEDGCLNVYLVDGGFRCLFQKFKITCDDSEFKHIDTVAQWLTEWFPMIGKGIS